MKKMRQNHKIAPPGLEVTPYFLLLCENGCNDVKAAGRFLFELVAVVSGLSPIEVFGTSPGVMSKA